MLRGIPWGNASSVDMIRPQLWHLQSNIPQVGTGRRCPPQAGHNGFACSLFALSLMAHYPPWIRRQARSHPGPWADPRSAGAPLR